MPKKFLFALFAVGAALGGCAAIDQAVDCNRICSRYKDCFDENYDVGSCSDRCEDMIDNDPHGADECEACIDDRSCSDSIFPCAAECSAIVP